MACSLVYPLDHLGDGTATNALKQPCDYDWVPSDAPKTGTAAGAALVDLDGDGWLDLVLAMTPMTFATGTAPPTEASPSGVKVMRGMPGGTFVEWTELPAPGLAPSKMEVTDINHDGRADVVVAWLDFSGGGELDAYLSQSDGTLKSSHRTATDYPRDMAVGDVNGDGNTDIVLVTSDSTTNQLFFFSGKGDGKFDAPTAYGSGDVGGIFSLTVSDVSQDGLADVVGVVDPGVILLLGSRDGLVAQSLEVAPIYSPWKVGVGDFDGDHVPDVAIAADTGFSIVAGTGQGTFFHDAAVYPLVSDPLNIAVSDLDQDGLPDVIEIADGQAGFRLAGKAGLPFRDPHTISRGIIKNDSTIAVGDIDHDNVPDVIVTGGSSSQSPIVMRGICK